MVFYIQSSSMDKKTERAFSLVTSKGKVVRVIREHYLRDDIYCQSLVCRKCKHEKAVLQIPKKLDKNRNTKLWKNVYYIIPSISVVMKFLDLFGLGILNNIIFCETILNELSLQKSHQRLKNRIRCF